MRRGLGALVAAAAALLLAGCAPTVAMSPAPQATSVGCAGVIVRLPATIGSEARRTTDAQSTAAWGLPASVTLTCGVRTPAVSAIKCQTVGGVDWLLDQRKVDGVERQVLTTFGREPGTEVVVDPSAVAAATVLDDLSDAVAASTRVTAQCLSIAGT